MIIVCGKLIAISCRSFFKLERARLLITCRSNVSYKPSVQQVLTSEPAASIWFEIGELQIREKNFNFSKEISICSGSFTKNYIFQAKIGRLQLLMDKLFYFSSKVTTFEHTSFA